eukprot:6193506-Pleurochrysis_carterae.AAC.6
MPLHIDFETTMTMSAALRRSSSPPGHEPRSRRASLTPAVRPCAVPAISGRAVVASRCARSKLRTEYVQSSLALLASEPSNAQRLQLALRSEGRAMRIADYKQPIGIRQMCRLI